MNSSYFGVERSTDGVLFTEIGRVKASGNSSITEQYSYLDANYPKTILYYRLNEVDESGASTYSNIISINIAAEAISLTALYPNPALNLLNYNLFVPEGKKDQVRIEILD